MKVKSNELGFCPFCNSNELSYGNFCREGDMCYYKWTCRKCGHKGEEWYSLEFAGHNVLDENDDWVEIEPEMIESEEN